MPRRMALTALTVIFTLSLTAYPAAAGTATCQQLSLPVALAPGSSPGFHVAARFCQPPGWGAGIPGDVDVLVPGATYNGSYWDWPQDRPRYSYVLRTLAAGRATFVV